MKLPKLEELNNPRFLDEAFIPEKNAQWIRASRLRRNVYLVLFLIGIACVLITSFSRDYLLTVLALFLAMLSLVVMSKYDTPAPLPDKTQAARIGTRPKWRDDVLVVRLNATH